MQPQHHFIFAHRGPRERHRLPNGGCLSFATTIVLTIVFGYRAVTEGPVWLGFMLPCALLCVMVGPYALWLHNRFVWALRSDGVVVVHVRDRFAAGLAAARARLHNPSTHLP